MNGKETKVAVLYDQRGAGGHLMCRGKPGFKLFPVSLFLPVDGTIPFCSIDIDCAHYRSAC